MTPEQFIKGQLAAYAYQEAAHCGGFASMFAVAKVIRNRVRRGWKGGDWMAVLNGAADIQPFEQTIRVHPDLKNEMFRKVLLEVEDIYIATGDDQMTANGLYYIDTMRAQANPELIRPWFRKHILGDQQNHPRVAQVGTLYIFS